MARLDTLNRRWGEREWCKIWALGLSSKDLLAGGMSVSLCVSCTCSPLHWWSNVSSKILMHYFTGTFCLLLQKQIEYQQIPNHQKFQNWFMDSFIKLALQSFIIVFSWKSDSQLFVWHLIWICYQTKIKN